MFIGREYELCKLNELYNEDKFHFIVIYGRRRIGKTALLVEFCKNKPAIFFVSEEYNDEIALEHFSKAVFSYFHLTGLSNFDSWENVFLFLGEKAKNERIIIVIDEFQYLVNSNKNIPSILQKLIDHNLQNTKLFFVICGSYVGFMEKEVLGYQSPLYGRRTAQFEIAPFNFFESATFYTKIPTIDKVMFYSVFGGTPQYLTSTDQEKNIFENIKMKILDKSSYLYEEPKFLLKQELREPSTYNSILELIATGSTKLNDIAVKLGTQTSIVAKYLKTLIDLKIIEKLIPLDLSKSSRSSIYRIKDNFFRFWYRFVFFNKSLIEQHLIDYVIEEKIKPYFNSYVGLIFEDIAMQYITLQNQKGKLPFVAEHIGKWWGNNPIKKQEEEIDITAFDKDNLIICECKWQDKRVGISEINSLMEKSTLFDKKYKFYYIFSKSGFTDDLIHFSKINQNIFLVNIDDLNSPCIPLTHN